MKKNQKHKLNDPVMFSRVKNYLAENVDKTFVDVSEMARSLKERYREYNNRSDSAFCQMVERAYKVVLQSYGLDEASSSEEELDLEVLSEGGSELNNKLLDMYKYQKKRRVISPSGDRSAEPINILSSDDDDDGETPSKLSHFSEKIKVPSSITVKKVKSDDNSKVTDEKKPKREISVKSQLSKKRFESSLQKEVKITFEHIGGISEISSQICDLLLHMKHPEVYKALKIKPPKGALLHGPPGTGKTLLAYAIAGKMKLPLVAISGTELVGGLSGESEERIRELFEYAESVAPCVLFLDEIDTICGNRENAQKEMEKRMVSQLLSSLDSLRDNDHEILVLAATNNPDTLDPALRRAGRLEQEISLGIPNAKSRKEILQVICSNLVISDDIEYEILAQLTPGFVGADLLALVNKASTFAVKRTFNEIPSLKQLEKQPDLENSVEQKTKSLSNGEADSDIEPKSSSIIIATESTPETKDDGVNGAIESQVEKVPEPELPADVDQSKQLNFAPNTGGVWNLIDDIKPFSEAQLKNICIKQQDFLHALKYVKPCAVKEGFVTVPDVTWDDIGSLSKVRKDLHLAVLAPVKYPELLETLGLSVPSGVLLCGPPGCGKTLLAKAVANEAGVNFISVKGPELLNMYVGESERAVRTCFRRARNSAPCVIFFDEFDALCPRRTQQDNNGATRVVNQLLTEMDGIESREGVFVLAASNRPDIIDSAVLRPGRLDRIIFVGLPGEEDRVDILQKITKSGTCPPIASDVKFEEIATLTEGYSGADLAGLVKSAATNALTEQICKPKQDDDIKVSLGNFQDALNKIKPSVSLKAQLHYEKMRLKYSSAADDNESNMEMETEANEESMETV